MKTLNLNIDVTTMIKCRISDEKILSMMFSKKLDDPKSADVNHIVYVIGTHINRCMFYKLTSLHARYADLPASPAGLLGRFAPSGFARVSRFALTKIFEKKKCVSIDSKCYETRKNEKINFLHFLTHYALRA